MKAAFLSCSLALLLNGHGCERTGEIQYSADLYCHHLVKSIETTIGLQNMVFPQASTPLKNETICYFNKKSCISCVLQIRDHVSLRNNENHIDFRFYNSLSDNLSDDIKVLVPEVISIEVDSIFDALPFPIIAVPLKFKYVL